jgi:hypothetical protein
VLDDVFPDGRIRALVGLAHALQLGDDGRLVFLLLSEVLVESERLVLWLVAVAGRAFALLFAGLVALGGGRLVGSGRRRGGVAGGGPWIVATGGVTPVVYASRVGGGVALGGFLDFELGDTVVASPRLVDLFIGIAAGAIALR